MSVEATSVGQIGLDLVVNQNQFNKQMSGIRRTASKIGKALAAAFAVKKMVDFGKQCVTLGSDLQEVQNVVDVTFPSMTSKVDSFAKSAAANFGLSETMSKKFTGTFGAMAKSFGFTEGQAYDMSSSLTGLAGDVASFYNITQDEAYTKLKSVFTGETESLKDLGVVMTQTALDQYALSNGFGKTTSAMTEQEKVALRFAFVQKQLAGASGDFARTSDSWANQTRILSLQFDSLKATIGQGLIMAFTPVIKVVNTLLGRLITLANAFKSFVAMLTGNKASQTSTSLNNTSNSADKVSNSISNANSNAKNLNNTTKKLGNTAKKAAKKISGLMGFDEINKLSSSKTSGSSGDSGSGSSGGSTGATGSSVDVGKLPDDKTTTKLGKGFDNLRKAVEKLNNAFSGFSKVVGSAFTWIWKNMMVPLGKWTMQKLAPKLIELLAAGLNVLTSVCKALQPLWQWAWDNLFKPLAKFVGNAAIAFLDLLVKGLNGLSKWIDKHQTAVQNIAIVLTSFFVAFKLVSFVTTAIGIITKLVTVFKFLGGITGILKGAFGLLASSISLPVVIIGLLIAAGVLLWKNWDKVKKNAGILADAVTRAFSKLKKHVGGAINKVIGFGKNVGKFFKNNWKEIGLFILSPFVAAFLHLYKHNKKFRKNVDNLVKTVKKAFVNFGKSVIKVFTDLVDNIKGVPKKIQNFFKGCAKWFSGLKDGFNDTLKKLGDNIPDLSDIGSAISDGIGEISKTVTATYTAVKEKAFDLAKDAWDAFNDKKAELVADAKEKASGALSKLHDAWETIKDKGAQLLAEAREKASGALSSLHDAWEGIKDRTAKLLAQAEDSASDIIKNVKSAFSSVGDTVRTFTGKAVNATGNVITNIGNAFKTVKDKTATLKAKAKNSATSTISKVKKGWNSLKSKAVTLTATFKDVFTKPLKTVWNAIADKINGAISIINKIPGVNIKGRVPKLAQGGYVKKNTPQLAMIGDNRHQGEVVAPEDKMLAMAKKAAELSGGNNDGQIITLLMELISVVKAKDSDVYLDGKKVTRTVNEINNNDIKAGKRPILI